MNYKWYRPLSGTVRSVPPEWFRPVSGGNVTWFHYFRQHAPSSEPRSRYRDRPKAGIKPVPDPGPAPGPDLRLHRATSPFSGAPAPTGSGRCAGLTC